MSDTDYHTTFFDLYPIRDGTMVMLRTQLVILYLTSAPEI